MRSGLLAVIAVTALLVGTGCGRTPTPLNPAYSGSIGSPNRGVLTAGAELPRSLDFATMIAGAVALAGTPVELERMYAALVPHRGRIALASAVGSTVFDLVDRVLLVLATAANRRLTFGLRGRGGAMRRQVKGLQAFQVCQASVIGLVLSAGFLAVLHHVASGATRLTEVGAIVGADAVAVLLRFLLLRGWVSPVRQPGTGALAE